MSIFFFFKPDGYLYILEIGNYDQELAVICNTRWISADKQTCLFLIKKQKLLMFFPRNERTFQRNHDTDEFAYKAQRVKNGWNPIFILFISNLFILSDTSFRVLAEGGIWHLAFLRHSAARKFAVASFF